MDYEFLRVEVHDGVTVLTLNRPEKRNALSTALRREIVAALEAVEGSRETGAAVLTGAGEVFCAGFDLSEFAGTDLEALFAEAAAYHRKVYTFSKPLIAAVNGPALAGGMDLAAMCDVRLASEKAVFGQPQVRMGVTAAFDLIRTVLPEGTARELCLTGRRMDAEEAGRQGLISRIVPADRLLEEAVSLARESTGPGPAMKALFVKEQPGLFI
ncbi:MAG: enoyl-CoA hydratase/isomerase family protein [Proteobacteria bacterium]|nr:enoyl-CoA hydratase/isomerase family protein [Pseudomonadota bacterium]